MLSRIKKNTTIDILIAVASILFGILIGPTLEAVTSPLFDMPTRAILSGLSFLAVLIIISLVTVSVSMRQQKGDMAGVSDTLSSIHRRLGLTVEFVHSPPNRSEGEVYRTSRGIIETAEKEILHLYYCRPQDGNRLTLQHSIETQAYQLEREKYMQAILDAVRRHKDDKFFYRRIYQFPEGESAEFTEERVGKQWFEHTQAILEIVADHPDAAVIKTAPLFLQQNILIVDERYIIWGIDAIEPEHNIPYYEGKLIFDDPHQEFVRYLKDFFLRVDARAMMLRGLSAV